MHLRPSRTNLVHIGVMAAVLIGSLVIVALAAGGLGRGGIAGSAPLADQKDKPDKGRSVDLTVTGTIGTRTAADGSTEYTITSGDTMLVLDAGPAWFFGDAYPLAPYVGKQVTITGEHGKGSTSVDVLTVDGTALREPGKPPWPGGWKKVGDSHPGWSQEKADRHAAKQADNMERFGLECWPPGHCKKDGSARDVNPGASTAP
jgi:hypothetical protein